MAKSREPAPSTCQIYLVIDGGDAAMAKLSAALDATAIASVLIRPGQSDATGVKDLVEFCQERSVATLIENDSTLARTVRADGVHLDWSTTLPERFAEARDILGNRYMIGVAISPESETARHEAMEMAEAGADYIGFAPGGTQAELLSWWAGIFEVPCVAFGVETADTAAMAAATGAEFLGLKFSQGASPADCAELVGAVAVSIAAIRRTAVAKP